MGTAENKQAGLDMWNAKGVEQMLAMMSDDVRWTIIGTTKFSRTMNGKQAVIDKLLTPLLAELESLGSNHFDNLIAEGDYVVAQQHANGRTTKIGNPCNNIYCMVYKVIEGRIREIAEYLDTELVTAAFGI